MHATRKSDRKRKRDEPPLVHPVDDAQIDGNVAGIFKEITHYYGFLPKLYSTLAHYPPLLRANWQKIRAVMGSGPLSECAKEAIAVCVSQANDCAYCLKIHSGMLKRLAVPMEEIRALTAQRFDDVVFLCAKEKALVQFVLKVNMSAPLVEREDIEALRELEASDAEIMHALGVMEVYMSYSKMLVALRVGMERDSRAGISYPPHY